MSTDPTLGVPLRILVATPMREEWWEWLSRYLSDQPYEWTYMRLDLYGKRQHRWFLAALRTAWRVREYDLVISHHPFVTFWLALAMKLTGRSKPHMAFVFNFGDKRFFRGPQLALARMLFKDLLIFVMYSEAERDLLGRMFRIPPERLSFQHWAVGTPAVPDPPPEYAGKPGSYVCCIGRNNRDFETFLAAVDGLAVRAVVVCNPDRLDPSAVGPNVVVKTGITYEECFRIMAGAAINIVPLPDNDVGAGHMTIVSAMQLGVPQIVTRFDVVQDYLQDDVHALLVEPGSPESLRVAIERLLGDKALRDRLAGNARAFADRWLSEEAASASLRHILDCYVAGKELPSAPPGWPPVAKSAEALALEA